MFSRRALLRWPAAGALAAALPRAPLARQAAFASVWSEATHSAIRLIGGGRDPQSGALMAGIEFRMTPGFKTYWRDPGDSGVPPTFDWSGSENAAEIRVLWPTPHRFEDGGGWSIGYQSPLVLPLEVTPANARVATALQLKIDYAVCEKMCIPAQGAAALALVADRAGPYAPRLAEAFAATPALVAIGAIAPSGLCIDAVKLIDGPKPKLAVDIIAHDQAAPLDLFVEGPKGSFFGRPKLAPATAAPVERRRLFAPIEERAKDAPRWPLRLTLVSGKHAIETETAIDAPTAR